MKRLIAFAIAAIMVLSMIPVMAFTASAAAEGDWTVYHNPKHDLPTNSEEPQPRPGYEYVAGEGFKTIAADYTNFSVYYTLQTKETWNLYDGIYLEMRMDAWSAGGEGQLKDNWISFNLSDKPGVEPGGTEHSNNWFSLVRHRPNDLQILESHFTADNGDKPGSLSTVGTLDNQAGTFSIPTDEDGKEIYTFEVIPNGDSFDIKVNGYTVPGAADSVSQHLNKCSVTGDWYVGITFNSGVSGGAADCVITKFGTNKDNATTPTGSDRREPDLNTRSFGEMIDASTVPAGQPALLWDANMTTVSSDPAGTNIALTAQGDGTFHALATGSTPYFMWTIKSELTYNAADFPVFAMMIKDFWGTGGTVYYCSGDTVTADDSHMINWTIYDEAGNNQEYVDDDDSYYNLIIWDLSTMNTETDPKNWADRIHSLRPSFSVDNTDPDKAEWDICYMGMFRTITDAQAYGDNYLGDKASQVTEAPTQDPATTTPEPENDTTAAPVDVTTAAPSDETKAPVKEEGCASVMGLGAVAILAAAAAAVALKKKG